MAGLTCLTDLDGVVLNVADRSDRSLAVKGNDDEPLPREGGSEPCRSP